ARTQKRTHWIREDTIEGMPRFSMDRDIIHPPADQADILFLFLEAKLAGWFRLRAINSFPADQELAMGK
ncbi:MAG TPA: hypothetical protein VM285_07025, partial [Polyangia bacterium]|nr:hypothetical protein [Polyangia bacterium]